MEPGELKSILAAIGLAPKQARDVILSELTWWALANYDLDGRYIGDDIPGRKIRKVKKQSARQRD